MMRIARIKKESAAKYNGKIIPNTSYFVFKDTDDGEGYYLENAGCVYRVAKEDVESIK